MCSSVDGNDSEKASRHALQDVCLPISKAELNWHILNSSHTETKENSMYQGYYINMILP